MEHRIEPEESWLLAPWRRKKKHERVALLGLLVFCVWGTIELIELIERGYLIGWLFMSGYWLTLVWAYFSRSGSREIIVVTELKLNGSHSVQAERRFRALK
jgi:hypothetical protein